MFNTDRLIEIATMIGIGSLSSGARYIFDTLRGRAFKFFMMFGYLAIGAFVGFLADQRLPHAREYRGGVAGLLGFLAFQTLEFVEKYGLGAIFKKLLPQDVVNDQSVKTVVDIDVARSAPAVLQTPVHTDALTAPVIVDTEKVIE